MKFDSLAVQILCSPISEATISNLNQNSPLTIRDVWMGTLATEGDWMGVEGVIVVIGLDEVFIEILHLSLMGYLFRQ